VAKFYVESGTLQMVVDADDARGAGLWAVHRCLEQVLSTCPEDPQTPEEKAERLRQRGGDVLSSTVRISERGFGRDDCLRFDTAELFAEWNQLLIAVNRLPAPPDPDARRTPRPPVAAERL
jgi:hypothetical protein